MPAQVKPVVLVVDDHRGIRDALTLILEGDHDVLTAASGRRALDLLRRRHVDLVLLDIKLPDIDGKEVLRQIKVIDPAVPVIMLTVVDRAQNAWETRTRGAYAYFTKPFDEDSLLACIREALRASGKASPTPGASGPAQQAALGRRRLLLVDSDIGRRAALCVALERGFVVDIAATGLEAFGRLSSTSLPDLVVYDVVLPATESASLLGALRTRQPRCPVIVTSTSLEAEVLRALGPHKVDSLLRHPVYLDQLLEQIVVLLELGPGPLLASRKVSRRTSRVVHHVGGHYGQELGRTALATVVHLTPRSLTRLLADELGVGVEDFVTRVRVKVAVHFLENTDEKVEIIASRCGFHDFSHMTKAVLRHTGRRPGDYRRPNA